jgi:hypothetical protein
VRSIPENVDEIYSEVCDRGMELIEKADLAPITKHCLLSGNWDEEQIAQIRNICKSVKAKTRLSSSFYDEEFFRALDLRASIIKELFREWGIEISFCLNVRFCEDWTCAFTSEELDKATASRENLSNAIPDAFWRWRNALYSILGILDSDAMMSQAALFWKHEESWIKDLRTLDFNTDS